MSTFVESKFGYCPIIWMFRSTKGNRKIDNSPEGSLRVVYDYYTSWLEDLLRKDNCFKIHYKNIIRSLAIELFNP